jgi:hypothetical protein
MKAAAGKADSPGRIYITRRDTGHRRVINEGQVIAELEARGFTVIALTGRTLDEQINLFRNAEIVVSPHGAGLSNVVFCEPDTRVYELLPHDYVNGCFNLQARAAGAAYYADLCTSVGDTLAVRKDIIVDMQRFRERLDEIEDVSRHRANTRAAAAPSRSTIDRKQHAATRILALESPAFSAPPPGSSMPR